MSSLEIWTEKYRPEKLSDVVGQEKIKDFARTKPLNAEFKIIFLDECVALTPEAQQALRRTMEKYTNTTRFILSCNYSSKIIPPIQSRCAVFRFKPLAEEEITEAVTRIIKTEKLEITKDGMEAVILTSEGDMRKAVNILQSVAITAKKVDAETVAEIAGFLHP